jgi:hypothetical protein
MSRNEGAFFEAWRADFIFDICPSGLDGVVTGTPTSCVFADNVRRSYFSSGGPLRRGHDRGADRGLKKTRTSHKARLWRLHRDVAVLPHP